MTRLSTSRRGQWGAVAVGCALALTYIPSADAPVADAHPEARGQAGWGVHSQQGAESPEQQGGGHERSHGGGGREQQGGAAGESAGEQGGSEQQGGSERQSGSAGQSGQPQGQGAQAQTQPTETQTRSEAGGRGRGRQGGGHDQARGHDQDHGTQTETQQRTKGHERHDVESKSQTAPAGNSSSGSTGSASSGSTGSASSGSTGSASSTTTSSTTASAPAPTTSTPTAAVSSSAPTVAPLTTALTPAGTGTTSPQAKGGAQTGVPTHHGTGHADRARHQSVTRGGVSAAHRVAGHPAASSPLALTAAGAGTKASRQAAARGAHQGAASSHPAPHGRGSPLVTTITTIADVVPLPVRFLLGLLLSLSLALGTRSWLAALRARRLERQRGELLEDVGLLQAALLPETPKHLGVVGTSAAYRPADGPGAGGDFYDVFALGDGRVAVILGDISGHGRQALPHTALVRFTLRAYMEAGLSPRAAVQTAESVLERQLGGSFATVVVATYDPDERTLVYACAGHPPPVVVGTPSAGSIESTGSVGSRGSVGSAELVEAITPITVCAAPPIGAGMRTGSRQTTVAVPGGAQVCFFTDGVTEARIDGELFGAGRLTDALAELGPTANASQLLQRVAEATDTRSDDMAACVLNIAGDPAAPAVILEELEFDRETPSNRRAEQLLLACGVQRDEIPELIANARHAAGMAGTAILELSPTAAGGPSSVKLRRDGVTHLPTALARGRAGVGAMVGATP